MSPTKSLIEEDNQMAKLTRAELAAWAQDAMDRSMNSLDNPGMCLACGHEAEGVEPDARRHKCEACGEPKVYGAMTILMSVCG